jgi:hypothetical protein
VIGLTKNSSLSSDQLESASIRFGGDYARAGHLGPPYPEMEARYLKNMSVRRRMKLE